MLNNSTLQKSIGSRAMCRNFSTSFIAQYIESYTEINLVFNYMGFFTDASKLMYEIMVKLCRVETINDRLYCCVLSLAICARATNFILLTICYVFCKYSLQKNIILYFISVFPASLIFCYFNMFVVFIFVNTNTVCVYTDLGVMHLTNSFVQSTSSPVVVEDVICWRQKQVILQFVL